MERTIKASELSKRPIIRSDNAYEFLNKMTDEEIQQWDKETMQILKDENVPEVFPDWNSAYLAKIIDAQIIYELFCGEHLKVRNDGFKMS
jgi:16S rRNA C967 or C1407 C5-methylase (RsmB/RsmF family)